MNKIPKLTGLELDNRINESVLWHFKHIKEWKINSKIKKCSRNVLEVVQWFKCIKMLISSK